MGISDIYRNIDRKLGGILPGGEPYKSQPSAPTPPAVLPIIPSLAPITGVIPGLLPKTTPSTPSPPANAPKAPPAPTSRGGGGGGGGSSPPSNIGGAIPGIVQPAPIVGIVPGVSLQPIPATPRVSAPPTLATPAEITRIYQQREGVFFKPSITEEKLTPTIVRAQSEISKATDQVLGKITASRTQRLKEQKEIERQIALRYKDYDELVKLDEQKEKELKDLGIDDLNNLSPEQYEIVKPIIDDMNYLADLSKKKQLDIEVVEDKYKTQQRISERSAKTFTEEAAFSFLAAPATAASFGLGLLTPVKTYKETKEGAVNLIPAIKERPASTLGGLLGGIGGQVALSGATSKFLLTKVAVVVNRTPARLTGISRLQVRSGNVSVRGSIEPATKTVEINTRLGRVLGVKPETKIVGAKTTKTFYAEVRPASKGGKTFGDIYIKSPKGKVTYMYKAVAGKPVSLSETGGSLTKQEASVLKEWTGGWRTVKPGAADKIYFSKVSTVKLGKTSNGKFSSSLFKDKPKLTQTASYTGKTNAVVDITRAKSSTRYFLTDQEITAGLSRPMRGSKRVSESYILNADTAKDTTSSFISKSQPKTNLKLTALQKQSVTSILSSIPEKATKATTTIKKESTSVVLSAQKEITNLVTGSKLRQIPTTKTTVKEQQEFGIVNIGRQSNITGFTQQEKNKTTGIFGITSIQQDKPALGSRPGSSFGILPIETPRESQREKQQEKQIQKIIPKKPKQSPPVNYSGRILNPITSYTAGFKTAAEEEDENNKEFGFLTFVKRRGRYTKVTKKPVSKARALSIGSRITDLGLGRTFKITKTKTKVKKEKISSPNLYKFRTFKQRKGVKSFMPGTYIEKSKYALEAPEQSAIRATRLFGF